MVAVPTSLRSYDELDGPPGLPLLGNLLQLRFDHFHLILERWADTYGPLYRFRIGPRKLAAVSDPDVIKRMHRERPDMFRRTRSVEAATREMRLKGVFSSEGDDWRRQRKIVAMALNTAHLKPFFPKLQVTTTRLLRRWERAADAGTTLDLCRELMRFTVDVTTQLAFGIDFNTLETDGPVIQHNLDKVFPILNWRVNAPFAYWRYLRLPRDRALDHALDELEGQVDDIIQEVHRRMAADPSLFEAPTNFLEAMIAAQQAEGIGFSDADVFANVCTLLLAGEDTTANTIAWTVNYLLEYPQHCARARAEVDGVLGSAPIAEAIEQTHEFPFVEAFYNEAMRLKPVAPINAMEPLQDVEMLGHVIPRGTVVMLLNRRIATRDENFGHAATFDPERWMHHDDARTEPHDTTTFLPFGTGPRFCPGRNLALLQIRTVLSMLLRNFDVEFASPRQAVEEQLAFAMRPVNLNVRLHRRVQA
ncbi:MAG: cytochrome P450 [Gammaproteobacteria bacterium]|nr:cytochrome P450 [Gammaproteobacteria bacterium]MCP5201019.1 cytochrome P450 [Gammaproteobacteria bacterium]